MTPTAIHSSKKFNITITLGKYPFKAPVLREYDSLEKTWYVEYYVWDETKEKLVRKRFSLNQPTRSERIKVAKEESKEILDLLKNGAVVNPKEKPKVKFQKSKTFAESADDYLNFITKTLSPATFNIRRTHIRRFLIYLKKHKKQNIKLNEIDTDLALAFVDDLSISFKISNRTRNNNKNELNTIFSFFKKRKLISENPFAEIPNLPQQAKKHQPFTQAETKLFFQNSEKDPQLQLFVKFIYYCYIRPRKELRLLKIKHILEKTILINAEDAKEDNAEHIMIPKPLEIEIEKNELRSYDPNWYVFGSNGKPSPKPTYYHQMYRRHKAILEKITLEENIDLYSWKHTGVITLWKATQDIELLRRQCRHSDIQSTIKYLRDLGLFTNYDEINKFPALDF